MNLKQKTFLIKLALITVGALVLFKAILTWPEVALAILFFCILTGGLGAILFFFLIGPLYEYYKSLGETYN